MPVTDRTLSTVSVARARAIARRRAVADRPVQPVEAQQGGAQHRRGLETLHGGAWCLGMDRPGDPRLERLVLRAEHARRRARHRRRGAARWSRRMIARAIVATSSACRSRIDARDAVPTGRGREDDRRQLPERGDARSRPCSIAWVTSTGRANPKCSGTSRSRLVRGPRPSRARTAAPSAVMPMSPPPPQSPEMSPSAVEPGRSAVRGDARRVDPGAADDADRPSRGPSRPGPGRTHR